MRGSDTRVGSNDRLGGLLFLVRGFLLAIAAIVVYLWMYRAGSDLTWDEAFNFRVYARNPLTAVGLYNEHNNHPLESFIKSLFVSVLGMNEPAMLRITGFLLVAGYLVIGWALFKQLARERDLLAATLLALMLLLTRGFSYQAMELRGYFLSIVLQFLYFFLLARETGFLKRPEKNLQEPRSTRWTRWTVVRYGFLAALIVFTLPSNLLILPALWVLTIAAFQEQGTLAGGAHIGRFIQLAVASAMFSVFLYAPIVVGLALGFSHFHNSEARPVTDALSAIREEIGLAITQFAPRGAPVAAFGWALLGVVGIAAVLALRPGRRLTRVGLLVIATSLLARTAFAAVVDYPARVRCALVPPLAIGVVLIVHDLTAKWSARTQLLASLALVVASFGLVPSLVAEAGMYRVPSDIASFLDTYCGPESRNVLIVHANLQDPLVTVSRVFGRAHVVSSMSEMDARFRGETPAARHAPGTWKRRFRDLVLPEDSAPPIDASKVEVLVLIDDETRDARASSFSHPTLDAIKARLPRKSEFRRAEYRMLVFEAPRSS